MKAIYDAGVKEISRNGIDEKTASSDLLMWKTLWDRNFLITATDLSVGFVSAVNMKI